MRTAPLLAALVALAFPTAASASTAKQYVLKHPKHERCKAHYTRKVEHIKVRKHGKTVKVSETVCIYTPPKPAPSPQEPQAPQPPAPSAPTAPALITTTTHVASTFGSQIATRNISATIYYFTGSEIHELRGEPVTYTITDRTTEHVVGSFTGTSNGYASCTIGFHWNSGETATIYEGEAGGSHPACNLAPVSVPRGDITTFTGTFAGNTTYAPSVSSAEPF